MLLFISSVIGLLEVKEPAISMDKVSKKDLPVHGNPRAMHKLSSSLR